MYLVDFPIFDAFMKKNCIYDKDIAIMPDCPFILEFRRGNIMIAKIEMSSIEEYRFLKRYPKTYKLKMSKNKYWIRGNEWGIVNGKPLQQLSI
jgi:hypothetical protein